ncbi:ATP phosphoribosyltransferase [Candidatus Peregrinibacteria bacterium]|nr:ATP phosphoribosyltransferase [Candidatus Peregrinibacteria bacterium]
MKKTRIALQSKGRLKERSVEFLRSKGLKFPENGEGLLTSCSNADIEILWLRDDDIPEYVRCGAADFGIVGENVLQEQKSGLRIIRKLGFSKCRLVIAVPKNSRILELADLEGERIATSYPSLLCDFLQSRNIHATMIPLSGSVEIAPEMSLSDAICDLVQSGNTLKIHNLRELKTIFESEAVLIGNSEKNLNFDTVARGRATRGK